MRSVTALVLACAIVTGACQTQRQAVTAGIVTGGIAGLLALGMYEARNDDEGPPAIIPLSFLAFGSVAIISFITAIAIGADDDKPAPRAPAQK